MNFRTTLSLLVLVVAVGIAVYFTRDKGEKPKTPETGTEHKLFDFDSADVTKVDLKSDDKHIVLQKTGSDWKLVEPVAAAAKTFEVDDLVRALTGLQSRGQVDAAKKASGGLDHPSFTVELTTKSKKTAKLAFGDSGQLGDSLYVVLNDNAKPDIVSNSVYSKLEAPASNYREMKLVNATSNDIKQVSITNKGKTIKLEKNGENWQITEPAQIPADNSAMWDILSGISNLNATEFLDTPSPVAKESVAHPRLSVWFSTKVPTTQPAGADAGQVLAFGGYRDALKKNIVAALDGKEYAVVPASSAKAFEKTTLDLRNKELLTVNPELVSTITLAINRPATTQPTTKPAELREFTIERRKIAPPTLGPALPEGVTPTTAPTTSPSTQPPVATTQPTTAPAVAAVPATKPAAPQSKWFFASGDQGDADEGQVDGLLQSFHPLRVEKYHDAETVTGTSYTLTIRTVPAKASDVAETYVVSIIDTGGRISASWKDVHFDVERSLVDKLTGDFKTKKAPPSPPPSFQGSGRPGLPPGLGE